MRIQEEIKSTPEATLKKELWRKHLHGQQKYHAFSFVADGRIMKKEVEEELVDAINYLAYQTLINRFTKEVILTWDEKKLNIEYLKIINLLEAYTLDSPKTERLIAKLYLIIKELS